MDMAFACHGPDVRLLLVRVPTDAVRAHFGASAGV